MIFAQAILTESGLRFVDGETKEIIRANFKIGEPIDCELKKHRNTRSQQQQRLFHELVHRFCIALSDSFPIVKNRWKYSYGTYRMADECLIDPPVWPGEFVNLKALWPGHASLVIFLKSEATYNTKEHSELTQGAIEECLENDVDIADILKTLAEHEEARGRPQAPTRII